MGEAINSFVFLDIQTRRDFSFACTVLGLPCLCKYNIIDFSARRTPWYRQLFFTLPFDKKFPFAPDAPFEPQREEAGPLEDG